MSEDESEDESEKIENKPEENEDKKCTADSIEDCDHFEKDGEKKLVGGKLSQSTIFKLQRIADEYYTQPNSEDDHKGNKTDTLNDIVEAAYKLVESNESYDGLKDTLLSAEYETEDIVSQQKYQKLKKEFEKEKKKRKGLEKRLNRLKAREQIGSDEELKKSILEIVEGEAKTGFKIKTELSEQGFDEERYDFDPTVNDISFNIAVEYLLDKMVNRGELHTERKQDDMYYSPGSGTPQIIEEMRSEQ